MALIEFKNLPDTSTPINAETLNHNFNELKPKNDALFGFTHIQTGEIYTLRDGKKFSDYKFIEFSTKGQTVIKSYDTFISPYNNWTLLMWYEDIVSGRTELVIEIEYVSDTQFKCVKSGYAAYGDNSFTNNAYPIMIRGIS